MPRRKGSSKSKKGTTRKKSVVEGLLDAFRGQKKLDEIKRIDESASFRGKKRRRKV